MSTKAIREALEAVRWDGLSGEEKPSYAAALAEVEAIERAAKESVYLDADEVFCGWWEYNDKMRWEAVTDTLQSIAKDAK